MIYAIAALIYAFLFCERKEKRKSEVDVKDGHPPFPPRLDLSNCSGVCRRDFDAGTRW